MIVDMSVNFMSLGNTMSDFNYEYIVFYSGNLV